MRHLTVRAREVLRAGGEERADLQAAEFRLACTAAPRNIGDTCVAVFDVSEFLAGKWFVGLPDCPKCLVLWDEALEEGARRKQKELDRAEWLRKDEDDNEAFWKTLHTGVPYKRSDR